MPYTFYRDSTPIAIPASGGVQVTYGNGIMYLEASHFSLSSSYHYTLELTNIDNHIDFSWVNNLFASNFTINSGTGDDYIVVSRANVTVNAGAGNDIIEVDSGEDVINGEAGNDTIRSGFGDKELNGGEGADTVDYSILGSFIGRTGVVVNLDLGEVTKVGFYTDTLTSVENVIGTSYRDTITGDDGQNTLDGNSGNDTINGGGGNDTLIGGLGNDTLNGGLGDDVYIFKTGDGDNVISEEGGFDTIELGEGISLSDITFTQIGNDLDIQIASGFLIKDFYSGDASNVVEEIRFFDNSTFDLTSLIVVNNDPDAVDDNFTVDENTQLSGTLLDNDSDVDGDVLRVVAGTYITTEGGSVTVNSDGSFDYTPALNFYGNDSFDYTIEDGNGGSDTATVNITVNYINFSPVAGTMDTLLNVNIGEQISFASNFTDVDGDALTYTATLSDGSALPGFLILNQNTGNITGTAPSTVGDYRIRLIASDAEYQVQYEFDLVLYGEITGTVSGEALQGASGDDTINGMAGLDYLHGNAGNDTIFGGYGEDRIYGNDGDDILNGERDNDIIYGHLGNDTIYGDHGWDQLYGLEGDDVIWGGIGNDVIRGDDASALDDYIGAGNDELHGGDGRDRISGGAGNDMLYGDAGNDTLWGNSGNDTLYGGNDVDRLYGLDGDDTVYGEHGNDYLYGGLGDDTLDGGIGSDRIYGNEGNDTIYGGDGSDYLYGLEDNDTIHGGANTDRIYGGEGNDALHGDGEADQLYGLEGSDTLYGGSGADRLVGDDKYSAAGFVGAGNDILYGNEGNDVLSGGAGDDTLYGGTGIDALYGSAGADTFAFASGDVDGNRDYIHDFSTTENDVIDISDVIDFSSVSGDVISDFVSINNGSYHTTISIDQDGAGATHSLTVVTQVQNNTGWDLATLVANGTLIVE